MKKYFVMLFVLIFFDVALACSPVFPNAEMLNSIRSTIITSPIGQFLLKLVPSRWQGTTSSKFDIVRKRDSYAIAFEVLPDGQFKQLWSFKHWDHNTSTSYMKVKLPEFYLSNDGKNLVEINPTFNIEGVVVVRSEGKTRKTYKISDLGVKNIVSGCPGMYWKSGSSWRPIMPKSSPTANTIYVNIRTIDNIVWEWEVYPDRLKFRKAK